MFHLEPIQSEEQLLITRRSLCDLRVELYWSESESENSLWSLSLLIATQCKHTTEKSMYPFQAISLSLQYNSTLKWDSLYLSQCKQTSIHREEYLSHQEELLEVVRFVHIRHFRDSYTVVTSMPWDTVVARGAGKRFHKTKFIFSYSFKVLFTIVVCSRYFMVLLIWWNYIFSNPSDQGFSWLDRNKKQPIDTRIPVFLFCKWSWERQP